MNAPKGKAPAPSKVTGAYGEQLSFLPPPPFCPTWPTRGTLADRALALLMAYLKQIEPERDQFEKVARYDLDALQARLDYLEGHVAELEQRIDELVP